MAVKAVGGDAVRYGLAVPKLRRMLEDDDAAVQQAATAALWLVDPNGTEWRLPGSEKAIEPLADVRGEGMSGTVVTAPLKCDPEQSVAVKLQIVGVTALAAEVENEVAAMQLFKKYLKFPKCRSTFNHDPKCV